MNSAAVAARVAALILQYGENIAGTRSGSVINYRCIEEIAPSSNIQQLAGVQFATTSGNQTTVTSGGVPETYPTLALFFDPSIDGGGGGADPVLAHVNDTFTRDSILLTIKEVYTARIADLAIVYVAIAQK